jgi:hypothetical protein
MPLVSTSIPNLLNGVSQQPSPLRQVTQGETQINALSSVIDGLIKRPATEHVAQLLNTSDATVVSHVIDRGDGNKHIVIVRQTSPYPTLLVWDINGSSITVNASNSDLQYLATPNPEQDLQFLTIADYTFVLNKTKTVAMGTAITPGTLNATKYQEFGDLPVNRETVYTGDAATSIFSVGFNYGSQSNITVRVNDAVVTNYSFTGDGTQIKFTSAPANGANILIYEVAPTGAYYEVIGDENSAFDNFYVKSISGQAYEETVKPGITYQLDATTMPYAIVPNSSTNPTAFTLQQNTWDNRTVGDLDSSPNPSFVGQTISNMFFFKNRLGFLSEEKVVMSAAGDFFRFFAKTVTTILSDDPIDVSVSHTKIALLNHAIAFNESLTLFADQTQFTIQNTGNLTPQSISIVPSTEFENDPNVPPVGSGNYLYFVSKKGDFSSVREYFIQSDSVITDALEVTAHVPKYIPKNLVKLATSSNEDVLFALSGDQRDRLYVYKWFSDGRQKLQSSWSTWVFQEGAIAAGGDEIRHIEVVENTLYLVVNRSDGVYLDKMSLQYPEDTGLTFNVKLDRKVTVTGLYTAASNTTTWTLPYEYGGDVKVVKSGDWPDRKGVDITNARPSLNTVTATGDYSAHSVIIGVPYTMTYEFSTQHVREKNGTQSVQSGRLQLRTMRINYEDTGFFRVEVTPEARQTYEYEFTGVVLNQANSTIEDVILSDGTFRFPVQSKNDKVSIKVTSDSYLPVAVQNAEWEGHYTIRSQRI